MSRTFELPLTGDADRVIAEAKTAAEKAGGKLTGDRFAGQLTGDGWSGHYRISGATAEITVEPDQAEATARSWFGSEERDRLGRKVRADAIIQKHILYSTGAGLIPIPVADLAAVTAVQVSMLEELARL